MVKRKRSFSEGWLSDEQFKAWIRIVPSDSSLFHCIVCKKSISCNSVSSVRKHAESASHKKNIGENTSCDKNNHVISKKEQTFSLKWLDIEQFKPWLREAENKNLFFCDICKKSYTAKLFHIYTHAESQLHKNNLKKSDLSSKLNTKIEESFLPLEQKTKLAEIRWAALIAEKNISLELTDMILNFFQDVGEDYNVLKSMKMAQKKYTKVIQNVLCPIETNTIVENIQNTKFTIFVDETSDISNEKWMTFYVRYVNLETLQVHSQLLKLIDIDAADCSAEKLFNSFKQEMWRLQIPFLNIIALSCDNAAVMTGKYLSFKTKLKEICKNLVTFPCPCHSAALVAHAACTKLPKICEEFVKNIVNFINNSPKKKAIFRDFMCSFEGKDLKILKLCNTRWLSQHVCINRLLNYWDTIKLFLIELISESTKGAENILHTFHNVSIKAYLLFLNYILNIFNKFNAYFQQTKTVIHELQPKSIGFLKDICNNFLKREVLTNFPKIIFSDVENHKSLNDVNLGTECERYLSQLTDNDANVVTTIRNNCLQFYITAAEEVSKKLPINNIFLSKLKVLSQDIFISDRETSFSDVAFIARTFGGFDEVALKTEWLMLNVDFTATEKDNLLSLNFDDIWIQILKKKHSNNQIGYPNLKSLSSCVRSLPNSNADPERIFSMLTDIKTKKRNKLSSPVVNSICVLKSALRTRGETALNMKIDAKHLSLMSTDQLYASSKKRKSSLQMYAADENIAGPSSST